jgi:hypothetical protein
MMLECRDRSDSLALSTDTSVSSFSLCPYRSGDFEGLSDLVTVAPLLDKFNTNFSVGVAIMSRH